MVVFLQKQQGQQIKKRLKKNVIYLIVINNKRLATEQNLCKLNDNGLVFDPVKTLHCDGMSPSCECVGPWVWYDWYTKLKLARCEGWQASPAYLYGCLPGCGGLD